ncbi:hypothetical protein [Rhizorhabdus histidinilytica]|uniref:hypothetical protein n=1 Tax=Rhizorhabdus histidinilytica TaxID=439228 RepID=UPI00321FC8E9
MPIERYLRPIVDAYAELVERIAAATGFPDQLLHVHAGLLILVLARLFTRRSFASPVPLAVVAAAELINEILDRLHHGRWMPDTASDVINTLFWPLVIFTIERWRSGGSGGRSRRR